VVDVRHEATAVFAADAVGRLTGTPGVAAVTAGPGVSNTITAVKNAQMAQSPLVLLGGATATVLRGRGSLQDIDQLAMVKPHVKWAARPSRVRDVVPALEQAFYEARSGVPGPVFVELAVDLLYDESVVREWYTAKTEGRGQGIADRVIKTTLRFHLANQFALKDWRLPSAPREHFVPIHDARQVSRAAALLRGAERPVMLLGSQVVLHPGQVGRVVEAVERMGVPVYLSGMARGLLGTGHPLHFRHNRRIALQEADLVLLAGVPSDFRLDYGSHVSGAKLIGVNRSREDLNKNRRPTVGIQADPARFLVDLSVADQLPEHREWLEALRDRDQSREAQIAEMAEEETEFVNPLQVCRGIERSMSDDSLLVVDGGDFVATASYIVLPRRPLSWLDPGVFGTLGVGAGFALGAKLVRPKADVWLLYGDGSAGYSIAELDTFVRHGLPVIAVVGNDAGWTQIARDQVEILKSEVGTTLRQTDYHKVAEGWGAKGIHLDRPEGVEAAMSEALALSRAGSPVVVNALIGKTDFRKGSISM
jgi:acetolactate synthase-1/2/3 large subunit